MRLRALRGAAPLKQLDQVNDEHGILSLRAFRGVDPSSLVHALD